MFDLSYLLGKFISLEKFVWIHVKVKLLDGEVSEIFLQNPTRAKTEKAVEEVNVVVPEPVVEVVPEALADKIQRMRFAKPGELPQNEEDWFKERQRELEANGIGQIQPEETLEVALEKLKKIGVE